MICELHEQVTAWLLALVLCFATVMMRFIRADPRASTQAGAAGACRCMFKKHSTVESPRLGRVMEDERGRAHLQRDL